MRRSVDVLCATRRMGSLCLCCRSASVRSMIMAASASLGVDGLMRTTSDGACGKCSLRRAGQSSK